ncbi:GxxExxY protein [bacterium]|nr:GxxExxY protein [bacterium]
MDLIQRDQSHKLIGAFFQGYNEIGPGFLDEVYHQSLEYEPETVKLPDNPRYTQVFNSLKATAFQVDSPNRPHS